MATTHNTGSSGLSHVERLQAASLLEDEGSSDAAGVLDPNAVDGMYLLNALINEEALLRHQANELEERAQEIERDHDDATRPLADQMRQQGGAVRELQAKVDQTIAEVRCELAQDPKKKISRTKVEQLHSSVSAVVGVSDIELASVESAHVGAEEHKAIVYHQRREHEHEVTKSKKKATGKLIAAKQSQASKKPKETEHKAETQQQESVVKKVEHSLHEAHEKVIHSDAWQSIKHTGHEVAESVHHGVEVVTHCAPVVAVVRATSSVVHGIAHPVETMHKMAARAGSLFHRAKATVCGWFGHGEEVPEEVIVTAAVPVKKDVAAAHRAFEMVKAIGFAGITGGMTVVPGDLTPLPTPMAPPAIHAPAVVT